MRVIFIIFATLLAFHSSSFAAENEYAAKMKKTLETMVRPVLADPALVAAIKEQNTRNAGLTPADIDRLDKQWRAEVKQGGGPLVNESMAKPVSRMLIGKVKMSNGVLSEMFVMDNKGLNVAQAAPTTDYFQGDEPKWQKTYPLGPDVVFVDQVDFDQSSNVFQAQISTTIVDPATGQAIGAVTVGMNVEKL